MSIRLQVALPERILDAAARLLARHGIRKTTMEDVAREASCSRAGLYKHFRSKDVVLQALFTREVDVFLEALRERTGGQRGPRHLEDALVFAIGYVHGHHVVRGIMEVEPEVLLTIFSQAEGGLAETAVATTASLVEILMERGDIRRTRPRVVAELLLRLLVSFVLIPKLADDEDQEATVRRLFREAVLKGIAKS